MNDLKWEDYIQFINEPKHLVNPIRDIKLFDTYIIEIFSSTPWYLIPIAYGPIIMMLLIWATEIISINAIIIAFLGGVLMWTFGEYTLHRFLFHAEDYWLPNIPKIMAFHFLIHGIHHAFPMDRYRLVFPPAAGYVIIYFCIVKPMQAFIPFEYQYAAIAGMLSAYIGYDLIHYYIHHSTPSLYYLKDIKKYHMLHHYKNGL